MKAILSEAVAGLAFIGIVAEIVFVFGWVL